MAPKKQQGSGPTTRAAGRVQDGRVVFETEPVDVATPKSISEDVPAWKGPEETRLGRRIAGELVRFGRRLGHRLLDKAREKLG